MLFDIFILLLLLVIAGCLILNKNLALTINVIHKQELPPPMEEIENVMTDEEMAKLNSQKVIDALEAINLFIEEGVVGDAARNRFM